VRPAQLAPEYVTYHWRNPKNGALVPINRTPAWWHDLYDLWLLGLNDAEIGRTLGRETYAVWKARTTMELEANAAPGGIPGPRQGST